MIFKSIILLPMTFAKYVWKVCLKLPIFPVIFISAPPIMLLSDQYHWQGAEIVIIGWETHLATLTNITLVLLTLAFAISRMIRSSRYDETRLIKLLANEVGMIIAISYLTITLALWNIQQVWLWNMLTLALLILILIVTAIARMVIMTQAVARVLHGHN